MKKKILSMLTISILVFNSCSRENDSNQTIVIDPSQKALISGKEINSKINQNLQTDGKFEWNELSDQMLWSAIQQGAKVCTIGFGNSMSDFERSSSTSKMSQDMILDIVQKYEGKSLDKILISSDAYLNQVDVLIEKQETIKALRRLKNVRYIEPSGYSYVENQSSEQEKSSTTSSGCGLDSEVLASTDYTTITPNAKAPWAFYKHNIPSAWNYSTGRGITIGIIDTGASPNQSLLNGNFNNGESSGRTVQRYGVYVDSIWPWSTGTDGPDDKCGHGTSMSSVAAAPRNDKGLPVGVAYNANLIVYRAASNVVLDGYHELNGVKNAFTALGNNPNVKIISMSMGNIISSSKIEDGVRYAYSKGKLIFCAGGTSTSFTNFAGVIFPAWMSEVVAVTGVKENAMTECDVCHKGSKIEFTVAMQRSNSGNTVPVDSYYDGQSDYVGGSSVATATTAGIAALVWAKNPSWTRDQVLNKMRQSASFYPNRDGNFGFGNVDALKAVQ